MKRSFLERYGVALLIIAIGGWFVFRQLGIAFIGFGQLVLILLGGAAIMYGIQMIRNTSGHNEGQEQQWNQYNPNVAPPPPPPMDETFSSMNDNKDNGNSGEFNTGQGYSQGQGQTQGQSYTQGQAQAQGQGYSQGQGQHQQYGNTYSTGGGLGNDAINRSVFIGDLHYGKQHWELKPMNLSAFIGDVMIDLSKAHIPYGETRIQITSFIGDVKIFVPNDVTLGVSIQMNAFIGDTKMMDQKESGIMRSSDMSTPNYYECERKVKIIVSTFIGDSKVKRVG